MQYQRLSIIINEHREIVSVSRNVHDFLGYHAEELIGSDILNYLHVEEDLPPRHVIKQAGKTLISGIVRVRTPNVHWRRLRWTLEARIETCTPPAFLIHAVDVTETTPPQNTDQA